jgi:hypothetical protein
VPEDQALREILKAGGIAVRPDALAKLSLGLSVAYRRYLDNTQVQVQRKRWPKDFAKFTRRLGNFSKLASRLANNLDITSPSGPALNILLSNFFSGDGCHGINLERMTVLLRRLEQAANEARSWALATNGTGVAEEQKKKGRKEEPKTDLFVDLRQVFIKLGGAEAIGDNGPLYRFVSASVKQIDDQIEMPKPESFRKLMEEVAKRRSLSSPGVIAYFAAFEQQLALQKGGGRIEFLSEAFFPRKELATTKK